jgi:hypothetical protein
MQEVFEKNTLGRYIVPLPGSPDAQPSAPPTQGQADSEPLHGVPPPVGTPDPSTVAVNDGQTVVFSKPLANGVFMPFVTPANPPYRRLS